MNIRTVWVYSVSTAKIDRRAASSALHLKVALSNETLLRKRLLQASKDGILFDSLECASLKIAQQTNFVSVLQAIHFFGL